MSSQVKTRMMCLSLPLNQGGPIPQGNVLIPYTRNVPKLILRNYQVSSKKLITKLQSRTAAAMVRHPAAYEEFLPSMSWILILRNLQLLAS